jgi:hypothetical protein
MVRLNFGAEKNFPGTESVPFILSIVSSEDSSM